MTIEKLKKELGISNKDIAEFFGLTPACKKAVETLINEAKEAFADWWENDGEENIIE